MAVSKRLRYEILRRDNHACRYCGQAAPDVKLTVDHVMPSALGGGDDAANLVTACVDCNAGKTSSSPDAPIVADVAADALRWSRAMQQAAHEAMQQQCDEVAFHDGFLAMWEHYEEDTRRGDVSLPMDWWQSVRRWHALGLDGGAFGEAIEIAMTRAKLRNQDVWTYLCGICWTKVRALQMRAGQILAAEEV